MPVGNPAPPRPRRFDCLTSSVTSPGAIVSARRNPWYPPVYTYSERRAALPSGLKFFVSGFSIMSSRILAQHVVDALGRKVGVKLSIHEHGRSSVARPETHDRQDGKFPVRGSSADGDLELLAEVIANLVAAHDPATDTVADHRHMFSDGLPTNQVI